MPAARTANSGWRPDSIFALAREPVFWLTPDRRIAMVNRAWEELTGHTEAEVIGLECRPHGPTRPGDLVGLGGSFCPPAEAMAGQPAGSRTLIIRRGGERVFRRVEYWPFHTATGPLAGLLGIVRPPESSPQAADSESQSLRVALLDLRAGMFARHADESLIGVGAEHRRVLDGVEVAVATTVPATIVGESGTGKRTIARIIHRRGPRRQMPLLGYDCQAIPAAILERELFGGTEPSGAGDDWGRLVAPAGATVVLGDVLQLPRDLQARLAAGLLGADRPTRLIATTTGNLDEALRDERLRPDLFHALTTVVIRLRPLRDRLDELPLLAQSLLERANLRDKVARSGFEPSAIAALIAYDWPGNLRELAEVIDEAHGKTTTDLIRVGDLPAQIRGQRGGAYLPASKPAAPMPLKERLLAFERQLIEEALGRSHQNKTRAARRLGVNRPFLYRRIKELGIADLEAAPDAASPPLDEDQPPPAEPPESDDLDAPSDG